MAEIRIKNGKAWLGVSGFGVTVKVYGQAPISDPVFLGETPDNNSGSGTFGNGEYAWHRSEQDYHYVYILTNGIGTYKIWAEDPDYPGVKSDEATYYFDPDNYQGGGDPFDWNGDGNVPDRAVPAKWFTIEGVHRRVLQLPSQGNEDFDHIVVSTSSSCDELIPNHRHNITVPLGETEGEVSFSGLVFAFPGTPGNTFYTYIRDHNCVNGQSNVYTISNVTSSGGNYDVGTLTLQLP